MKQIGEIRTICGWTETEKAICGKFIIDTCDRAGNERKRIETIYWPKSQCSTDGLNLVAPSWLVVAKQNDLRSKLGVSSARFVISEVAA